MGRAKRPVQVLREAMAHRKMTAIQLADSSGVHVTLIRRYLDGDVEIGLKNAPRLADALEIEASALLFGERAA